MNNCQCLSRRLSKIIHQTSYTYIRQKHIDEICEDYGQSTWDKIKMYTKMFAHIGKQGFAGARNDIKQFQKLRQKPEQQRTQADWNQLVRMRHDFYRLGPLWIIQILPFSGPLFILYMYTYPGSIPSWFIIDQAHEEHELKIRQTQKSAIQYFKTLNIQPQQINFAQMSLEEARRLAECLYGYYRDGTKGYNKVFNKEVNYIISEGFSKYLIKRKLKYKFNGDLHYKHILQSMSLQQKIRWKYEQVVINNKPMKAYQQSLEPEEFQARKQYKQWKKKHQKSSPNKQN